MNRKRLLYLVQAAVLAALYLILTLPFAAFSFGALQFRFAEALTVLPIVSPAAIPGLFLGCLLANLLNPQNLGLVDIVVGSLATLLAAFLSFGLGKVFKIKTLLLSELEQKNLPREAEPSSASATVVEPALKQKKIWRRYWQLTLAALPPVLVNGIIVGSYLPYLLSEGTPAPSFVFLTIGSITLTQAAAVFLLGLPLLLGIARSGLLKKL